ncbi:MAG: sigma-70 family RNA polymerase sigma factor [Acidobacteria bacterium]|nr:sigma-70 family RNA polymerase sigma factor [Acidobacteriota bacterium]
MVTKPSADEVTALLIASSQGNRAALDRLMPLVYEELRALARVRLRNERQGHSIGTVGLIHEAYLKLIGIDRVTWKDRAHFLATASRFMRRILVDEAHRRHAAKRGGRDLRLDINDLWVADDAMPADAVLALDEALERLASISPRGARAIECRHFAGLSLEETAATLGVSVPTVKRDVRFSEAWLASALARGTDHGGASPDPDRGTVSRRRRPDAVRSRRLPGPARG